MIFDPLELQMKLSALNPRQALNKAYLKVKPTRSEIELFKLNLIQLLERTNEVESEEFHKNLVSDFLKKTYYEPNHFINTKGRNDLVIHNGEKAINSVGVIIEAKKPTNKSEMVSGVNVNTKAFHELILYYLRERVTLKNLEIKNLIITNINEWFIFDANNFEKLMMSDSHLVSQFEDFEAGRLSGKTTDFFYKWIAEPLLNKYSQEIMFTHFDIRNYKKVLINNDPKDDNILIALYKLLSPEHLLKLPFKNDNNTLDKRFYAELLHVIGLEETKEGSKKIIQRKKESRRNHGALIEDAIIQLDSLDKINRIEKPNQYGVKYSERLFNVALELCITWINRILFLKLLEAQLITYHKGDKSYSFLNIALIKNFDDLNSLFFQVLAKSHEQRNLDVKDIFAKIPYLNSSLFEVTELEHSTILISNLKDDKTIPIDNFTMLKDKSGKKKTGNLPTLNYLFEFLDAYDFSGEGSEEIQEDNKTLINASVLGLIFEKINGYKDGSFFTPSFITMFMCRDTLRKSIVNKFNKAYNWSCKDFTELSEDLKNKIKNDPIGRKEVRISANNIVNSIKICDPAVGSGHFLVSALNELISVKNDLNILVDKNSEPLNNYIIELSNDELIITNLDSEIFEYNYLNKESQRVQECIFHEKQRIIENCLFGVDINPNSVKICRLRLWIELLKNAYYKTATELETLPNIDINIKCGNSIISRFELDSDLSQALKKHRYTIEIYRNAVSSYRSAKSKDEKKAMEKLINDIKTDITTEISSNDKKAKKLRRISGELFTLRTQIQLFEQTKKERSLKDKEIKRLSQEENILESQIEEIKSNKIFENAFEWRFEFPEVLNDLGDFIGFDVIIGNPPYIYNRDLEIKQRTFLKNKYDCADDLYVYFTYEALKLLNVGGLLNFITPDTYFTLSSREVFRKKLLEFSQLEFTYSGFCFEDAYVETMILQCINTLMDDGVVSFAPIPNDFKNYIKYTSFGEQFKRNIYTRFFIPTPINLSLNEKLNSKLIDVAKRFELKLIGRKQSDELTREYSNELVEGELTLLGAISDGEQGLVTGNNSKYISRIVDTTEDEKIIAKRFIEELDRRSNSETNINDYLANQKQYHEIAEKIKIKERKTDIFGKFFIYKVIKKTEVLDFANLTENIKNNGGDSECWVNYYKGNSEGFKWFVPYSEAINWSESVVTELKEGKITNSRWQGSNYFNATGFGWVDYFTNRIKSFFVEPGIYSKNIVKLHSSSDVLPDKYLVGLLNSKFISFYIKQFITTTHTLQINDGRLIPIMTPTSSQLTSVTNIVDEILKIKKNNMHFSTSYLEDELDRLVFELYKLDSNEIDFINES